jgi:hypothetical protein
MTDPVRVDLLLIEIRPLLLGKMCIEMIQLAMVFRFVWLMSATLSRMPKIRKRQRSSLVWSSVPLRDKLSSSGEDGTATRPMWLGFMPIFLPSFGAWDFVLLKPKWICGIKRI